MSSFAPSLMPIHPITHPFRASLTPPGSRSLTNRLMILAALTQGRTVLTDPLRADDTIVCAEALRALGHDIKIIQESDDAPSALSHQSNWPSIAITGRQNDNRNRGEDDWREEPITINLRDAGTATRFLTAACTMRHHPTIIDGGARMRQRPIGELVNLLRQLGARIEYLKGEGFVPLRVEPVRPEGGSLSVGPTLSSQYISALLLIAPLLERGIEIEFTAEPTSPSYLRMTLACMARFGAMIEAEPDLQRIAVAPGSYRSPGVIAVEPDASNATYFLAAASLLPGGICTINGLGKSSIQGDAAFVDVLSRMGAGVAYGCDFLTALGAREADGSVSPLHGIDIDMGAMPDAAMTLAVLAAFAQGETVIRGLHTLRHKESDRLSALKNELTRLGADVEIEDDQILVIEPAKDARSRCDPMVIETYHDHRMAMAFAIAGLVRPGVSISDPGCVDKTYPTFWDDLEILRHSPVVASDDGDEP